MSVLVCDWVSGGVGEKVSQNESRHVSICIYDKNYVEIWREMDIAPKNPGQNRLASEGDG